jgi:hypothetical protein
VAPTLVELRRPRIRVDAQIDCPTPNRVSARTIYSVVSAHRCDHLS